MDVGNNLDNIARKLLSELQKDPRATYAELGRRVGLSPSATAERVRRLEEAGIVLGYHVEIDPAALGLQRGSTHQDELRWREIPSVSCTL